MEKGAAGVVELRIGWQSAGRKTQTQSQMNPAYLLTKPDGSTVLLFNRERAYGLAHHFGWSVVRLSADQARQHIRATLKAS